MQLDPTGCAGHRLAPVFSSPSLDEAHPYSTHPGQLIHGLKSLVYRLRQEGGELLIIKDLQITPWRDLAYSSGVPTIPLVTVRGLYKDRAVTKAFGKHLAANVVQTHSSTYVSPGQFHRGVAVDVGEKTQAEALRVGRVCESIHRHGRLGGVKGFPDSLVKFIV